MKWPAISWKHISAWVGLYTVLGFIWWLIRILSDSARWCGVGVGAAKATGQKLPVTDCTSILLALIDNLGKFGLVLVGAFAIGLLTWIVVALGTRIWFRGPWDTGGSVGGDDHHQEPRA